MSLQGPLQLRELFQQKSAVSFVKAGLSCVFVSRDKQAVSATHRGAADKTLVGYAPQITSGFADLTELQRVNFQRTRGIVTLSSHW